MASSRLRLGEVRAALRLVGDCRDLGIDPAAWRAHALGGVCRLVGGQAALGGEMRWERPDGAIVFAQALSHEFSDAQLATYAEFLGNDVVNDGSVFPSMQKLAGRLVTRSRSQFMTRRAWERSAASAYYRAIGVDQQVISLYEFAPGRVDPVTIFRGWGERDFSDRERRLVRFCHAEIGRLIGPTLSPCGTLDRLPPRVRQTLDCLLEGDSEKQVAARLGLSRVTVHQYVTALYRHFGVGSRAELLARFIRRPPPA